MKDKVFIIKTFQDNDVPASFDKIKIFVVGQDIVIKTDSGEVYEYPFAAQFLSMAKDVFHFKFADGKVISSKELMNYVGKNDFDIDGSLTVHKTQNNHQTKGGGEETKDGQNGEEQEGANDNPASTSESHETTVVKVEEVVVEKNTPSASSSVNEKLESSSSDFTNVAAFEVEGKPERPVVISSSTSSPEHRVEVSPPTSNETKNFKLTTLQMGDDINQDTHHFHVGGSRTDGSYVAQYGRKTVDLSQSHDNWTVNGELNGWDYNDNSALRIVSVSNVDKLTSVQFRGAMTQEYRLILSGTPEGDKLGLKPNEFAVVYPRKDGAFSVDINFNHEINDMGLDAENGKTTGTLDFKQQENPSAVVNDDGSINLGYTPNSLTVKLGSGDDTINAGLGDDIYDGGAGTNSLDYSQAKGKIVVDLTKDVSSDFNAIGVVSEDAGSVSVGGKTQYINNFKIITGSDFNDSFILNSHGHVIYGGKGDDTFTMNGGSNTLHGGEGVNTIDYTSAGVDQAYENLTLAGLGDTLNINGVTIDFSKGVVTHNGWLDNNSSAGKDTFTDINVFHGSQGNDHIILGTGNTTIIEKVGDNYIEAGGGSHIIDGGSGQSILDYTQIGTHIDVNLNSGAVNKSELGHDTISNVHHVIGATGGTAFTGQSGGHNTLVGVDGINSFTVDYGYNQLYGGKGSNTYHLKEGNSTIFGGGNENSAVVNNSILVFYGASGQQGNNADYINNLEFSGGTVSFTAGEGKSTNNIISHKGGTITFHSQGHSTFLAENAGDNNIFIDSGTFVFNSLYGGNNILTAAQDTATTIMGGQASHAITLAQGATLSLDYSKDIAGDHKAVIDLDNNRNTSLDNDMYVDQILGEGKVSHISGLRNGDTHITLSQTLQEDITLDLHGKNNDVKIGKGLVDITVDNVSETNKIDYSALTDRLEFDLSDRSGNVIRHNGPIAQRGEMLKNVNYIIGNNANGNIYKGSNEFDVTFETGTGYGNTIIETEGNHTYYTQGYGIKYNASYLNEGIIFEYVGASGTVRKGETVTILTGSDRNNPYSQAHITEVHGTNFNDTFVINADNRDGNQDILSLVTEGGLNTVQIKSYGLYNINIGDTVHGKPENAHNTLELSPRDLSAGMGDAIFFGENGQKGNIYAAKDQGFGTSSIDNSDYWMKDSYHIEFDYIDKIKYFSSHALFADWGTSARGINIVVNNGDNKTHLLVNGGGNIIDAGYSYGANNKVALVSYNENTKTGIIYDAMTSDTVRFSDGRKEDLLLNFNQLQGSNYNDIIKLKSGLTLISSDGNDTLTGNGASYQLSTQHTKTNANFITNKIGKFDSKSNHLGTDTIEGDGFDTFALSKNSVYADIYAGSERDMTFYLNKGTVHFYSSSKSNRIDTGAAELTLDYKQLATGISVTMAGGSQNRVSKNVGGDDTFTTIKKLIGTNHGDAFHFSSDRINYSTEFVVESGSGVDSYSFNGCRSSNGKNVLSVIATRNDSQLNGELFEFKGFNGDLTIESFNSKNCFNFTNTKIWAVTVKVKSEGGNKFNFDNVNADDKPDRNNITLESSTDEKNSFSFVNYNKRFNIYVNGGENEFNFNKNSFNYLINIDADNNSHNVFNVNNSYLGSTTFTSKSGHDTFNLNTVTNSKSNEMLTININNGDNTSSSHSLDDFNHILATGNIRYLTVNAGNKNDSYDFSAAKQTRDVSINDTGGDNIFNLSGNFISSKINSMGSGNDNFTLDGVSGSDNDNKFIIQDSGGSNQFTFLNQNKWVDVTSGSGNDIFYFTGTSTDISINSGAGDDTFNVSSIGSLPSNINGGAGHDKLDFSGNVSNDFDLFNYAMNNTKSIEEFKFNSLDSGQKVTLDFSNITQKYNNDNNGTIDIYVGDKNNISIINDDAYHWTHTANHDGSETYSNIVFGDVNVHYDHPASAA